MHRESVRVPHAKPCFALGKQKSRIRSFLFGAQERTRTSTPYGTPTSRVLVYQFQHLGNMCSIDKLRLFFNQKNRFRGFLFCWFFFCCWRFFYYLFLCHWSVRKGLDISHLSSNLLCCLVSNVIKLCSSNL